VGLLSNIFGTRARRRHRVAFDDVGVTFAQANGTRQLVRWSELVEVGVLTTDEGPTVDDVHWVLIDQTGEGFAVPSESEGMKDLLARLQSLPGFDNQAVIEAMGSSQNAKFVCWTRRNVP